MVDIRKGSLNGKGKCAQQCNPCIKDIYVHSQMNMAYESVNSKED